MKAPSQKSSKLVLGSQYFLYFGVLGIFLPFFNLYCYHLDFSGFQIGALSAARSLVMVVCAMLWGLLADRFESRRSIFIGCSLLSTTIWLLFLFTTDFKPMLLVTVCYAIFFAPIISFLEAFTMDVLGAAKKKYGRLRAWGSISFIVVVTILGPVIDRYGIDIIIGLIFAGSLLQGLISFGLPKVGSRRKAVPEFQITGLLAPRMLAFLFCAFLMLISHGTYYGFFSIHLENIGYGPTFIGFAWALACMAEILVMIRSDGIFSRFSIETVLIFSFAVAALRWFVLFFAVSPLLILTAQLLHAVTYGAFHIASILYIDHLSPSEAKTLGQAINNAVTYGLGMMVGFFANGYLYESLGSFSLFSISGGIALFAGIVFSVFQRVDARQHTGV